MGNQRLGVDGVEADAPNPLDRIALDNNEEVLRRSEGGLAIVQRCAKGETQWLAQWNEKWQAYFFVGGHRADRETFRECVIREITEELDLSPAECPVAECPAHHFEYQAVSKSANELTSYTMELFEAHLTQCALDKIGVDPNNRWLTKGEILRMEADDGRPVSESMAAILSLAKLIAAHE